MNPYDIYITYIYIYTLIRSTHFKLVTSNRGAVIPCPDTEPSTAAPHFGGAVRGGIGVLGVLDLGFVFTDDPQKMWWLLRFNSCEYQRC